MKDFSTYGREIQKKKMKIGTKSTCHDKISGFETLIQPVQRKNDIEKKINVKS